MRLLHCHLRHVRVHGDLTLRFAPGLTVIGGANETGKSTLVEALHRALFLKAAGSSAPAEALRSRNQAGLPVVQLGFEARGQRWTLMKRFSGSSGSVSLTPDSGPGLSGPAAEETLASLLGVREILSGGQKSQLPSRWAHLWVMQGQAGENLLAKGGAHYDLDALVGQLEQGGGAALQSPLDLQVSGRIDALLAENFTARDNRIKARSPLQRAQEAQRDAQAHWQATGERLANYEAASDELAQLEARLTELQQRQLPELRQRRQALAAAKATASRLRQAIALQSQALEPDRLLLRGLRADKGELQQLEGAIRSLQEKLGRLGAQREQAAATVGALATDLTRQQQQRQTLATQLRQIERRGQLVAALLDQAREERERERLQRERQQRLAREQQRRILEKRLAELPRVDGREVEDLRRQQAAVRDARTRLAALATGVELLGGAQAVRLDGQALTVGDERQLSEAFDLQVGDDVRLRISPGGGQALGAGRHQLAEAEQAFQAALERLGVADVATADQLARERESLRLQLNGPDLAAPQPTGMATEPAAETAAETAAEAAAEAAAQAYQLEALRQRLETRRGELAAMEEVRRELEAEGGPLPQQDDALAALVANLRQTYSATRTAQASAESVLASLEGRLEQARASEAATAQQQAVLEAEGRSRQERHRALLAEYGSADSLAQNQEAVERRVAAAAGAIAELQRQLAELDPGDGEAKTQRLEGEIERAELECHDLLARQGAARERCASISAGDPYAAEERARVARDNADAAAAAIGRLTGAQQLLRQLFHEARTDLSSRYTEPLALAIGQYLEPLLEETPTCQLSFEQPSGYTGLRLRRGADFFDFDELSGGMREQLSAALRLAMADVLKGGHEGSLPLIFDDAFTNSDQGRVGGIQRMLTTAVQRGLQVIVLTCHPERYTGLEAAAIALPSAPGGGQR
jgi:energy-coupling factor transporter ATP-binding protein EcfA2